MDILQLQYFFAVATGASMAKATDALHVSQPTLSVAIKWLEEELQVMLFTKQGRSLCLTPAGEEAVRYVEQVLDAVRQFELRMEQHSSVIKDSFTIATTIPDIPLAVKEMVQRVAPYINIQLTETDHMTAESLLRAGKADICFTLEAIEDERYLSQKVVDKPLLCGYLDILYITTTSLSRPWSG